jgi:hypothetical protein
LTVRRDVVRDQIRTPSVLTLEQHLRRSGLNVYVRPFPNVEDWKWRASRDGGGDPLWSPDGRELFYLRSTARSCSLCQSNLQFST